jgi:DNA-binding HxlR family transcriptional regulator
MWLGEKDMEKNRSENTNVQQTKSQNISRAQLHVLMAIANGHEQERSIQRTVGVTASTLRQQIRKLESRRLIEKTGLVLRSWKLTEQGVDAVSADGWQPDFPQVCAPPSVQRNETRITTTFGTAFKVAFAAILGIFVGVVTVGVLASLVYWAGYTFVVRNYVPARFLPYVPLDNPLVDIMLGLLTSVALFAPLRSRLSSGLIGR